MGGENSRLDNKYESAWKTKPGGGCPVISINLMCAAFFVRGRLNLLAYLPPLYKIS